MWKGKNGISSDVGYTNIAFRPDAKKQKVKKKNANILLRMKAFQKNKTP